MKTVIQTIFYLLTVFLPLTFTTVNNELFEFPKFIILLIGTSSIALAWIFDVLFLKSTDQPKSDKKQKTTSQKLLKLSLIAFLFSQTLSTIFSIHPYTSFWGYYTRFHQGLLTTICYTILFFAYLKYMDKKSTQKLINLSIITSSLISIYAILERLGIDKNLWVQDVVNRPFATLGQPNWLAAYLLPNIYFALNKFATLTKASLSTRQKSDGKWGARLVGISFFILTSGLILTKSRSAYLALGLTLPTYFLISFWQSRQKRQEVKIILKTFLLTTFSLILSIALFGTPWTQPLNQYLTRHQSPTANHSHQQNTQSANNGGTESGEIRKIVWQGAWQLFKQHPLLGTGVETFAYSYYWTRPIAHNYVSEWDFLYNKAHNEYLNFLATTGLLGLFTYLAFPLSILLSPIAGRSVRNPALELWGWSLSIKTALLALLIDNFFGFSVIPVAYFFYLLPAILITSTKNSSPTNPSPVAPSGTPRWRFGAGHWSLVTGHLILTVLTTYLIISHLFIPDLNYTKARNYFRSGQYLKAIPYFNKAVQARPKMALYHTTYAEDLAKLTLAIAHDKTYQNQTQKFEQATIEQLNLSKKLNPWHLNFYKSRAKALIDLAQLRPNYYQLAAQEIEQARQLAPTDPKLAYNLGLIYARLGDNQKAIQQIKDAIQLKKDYPDPYYALTLLYEETKQTDLIPPLLKQAQQNLHPLPKVLQEKIKQYL